MKPIWRWVYRGDETRRQSSIFSMQRFTDTFGGRLTGHQWNRPTETRIRAREEKLSDSEQSESTSPPFQYRQY